MSISVTKRYNVYGKTNGKCWFCGKYLTIDEVTMDHSIPQSRGGYDHKKNLLPACRECNRDKGARTIGEFKGFLKEKIPHIKCIMFYGEVISGGILKRKNGKKKVYTIYAGREMWNVSA